MLIKLAHIKINFKQKAFLKQKIASDSMGFLLNENTKLTNAFLGVGIANPPQQRLLKLNQGSCL